jgi:hypothetical protein
MKTWSRFMVLAALMTWPAYAQDVTGDWQGTIKVGAAELRIAVHITRTSTGGLDGTLDSVDQGVKGIPVTSITLEGSKVSFRVEAVNGAYEGKVSSDGTAIDGTR